MREPAAACIRLCDEVVALAPGPELEFRALGHRGLGHLADYDPAAAQVWLDRAVAVARDHAHPYAEYEALVQAVLDVIAAPDGGPLGTLHTAATRLQQRPPDRDPVSYAIDVLQVPAEQATAGDDIFRFHVLDLPRLRALAHLWPLA